MSDSEALLSKADALLFRLKSSAQEEFPVLTEIVDLSGTVDSGLDPSSKPQQLSPFNDVDVDNLCRQLRVQLTQTLDLSIRKWADEILLKKLEQEVKLALQHSLERAMDDARGEILLSIGEALSKAIDTEIRARLGQQD